MFCAKPEERSDIGALIDMDMGDFERELEGQKPNAGVTSNMVLLLEAAYHELAMRKDAVFRKVQMNDVGFEEGMRMVASLYAEMAKAEEKVVALKERSKRLLESVKNDTAAPREGCVDCNQ